MVKVAAAALALVFATASVTAFVPQGRLPLSRVTAKPVSASVPVRSSSSSRVVRFFADRPQPEDDTDTTSRSFDPDVAAGATVAGLMAAPMAIYGMLAIRNGWDHPAVHLEVLSYMVVLGIAGWSGWTKVKTGRGLPLGPGGFLGMAETLSVLAVFCGVLVAYMEWQESGTVAGLY